MGGRYYCKSRRRLLFADLAGPNEIARILEGGHTVEYKRRETIFREGDESRYLYVIIEGRVEFTLQQSKRVLDIQFPGEYFGELGVFDAHRRSATATAMQRTVCRVMERASLLSWLEANPGVAIELLCHATLRIRDLSAERASGYRRVVEYIERNAVPEDNARAIRSVPPISLLARMLDMSREHLSKILGQLEDLGCIALEDGCLRVWKPLPKAF